MEESARIALGQLEVEKRRGRWWRRGQSDNQGGKKRIGEMEDNRGGRRGDGGQSGGEGRWRTSVERLQLEVMLTLLGNQSTATALSLKPEH